MSILWRPYEPNVAQRCSEILTYLMAQCAEANSPPTASKSPPAGGTTACSSTRHCAATSHLQSGASAVSMTPATGQKTSMDGGERSRGF